LCEAYYEPVAAFLRCQLRDADAARDLTHEFFAAMLAGGAIARAGEEFGRFRSYLLGAAKHFLAHQREAGRRLKRGGGAENVSLDDESDESAGDIPDAGLAPDAAFDRQWALTVLGRALDALQAEMDADGAGAFFQQVKPWLTGDAAHGDQTTLATHLGMNANALKVAIHRLKRRFRDLLKAEIVGTLGDPAQIDAELRALFAALGG
jgi:RNA polymerase sigma-70 factor (ECF subfamily)